VTPSLKKQKKGVNIMAKRKRLNYKKSKKLFTKTAKKVNRKNSMRVMRGGIRF